MPRQKPRRESMITRRVALMLGAGVLVATGLSAGVWALWLRPKAPPAATADQVYATVTNADPAKMSEAERTEWAAAVGDTISRLPPQEAGALLKKTFGDDAWRERFGALNPQDRRKLFGMVPEDQKVARLVDMVEKLKAMTPDERQAFFEKSRGFGPGGPGGYGSSPAGGGSASAQGQASGASSGQPSADAPAKKGRGAPTAQRVAQRIASTTPLQRCEFRQAMAALRAMRQQAGVGGAR